MADELKASPQSPSLAWLAEKLRAARSAGDTVTIPYLGGVGTMMLGKSPEEVTEWSYGNAPLHVPAMTRVPQFKKDRAEQLADTLFAAQAAAPVARMAPRVARELAPAAGAMAMRAAEVGGMPVGGLGVIKHKGGNWLAGSVENAIQPLRKTVRDPEFMQRIAQEEVRGLAPEGMLEATHNQNVRAEAINKWLETKLAKYIKNEMGTPEDPIRALAEKGVTHAEVAPIDTHGAHLDRRRVAVGFPAEGMGVSPQAKAWEAVADDLIHNLPAGERINVNTFGEESALRNLKQNPWLAKVPPETMTYGVYGRNLEGEAQFGHLIDELRNAVNPESGLPANLRWKYGDLEKVTVPQAVQRVHDINTWRAEQKAAADLMRANNAAAVLHKDYPDAPYKWVELKHQETDLPHGYSVQEINGTPYLQNPQGQVVEYLEDANSARKVSGRIALEDALKYEGETMGHCVGGYCPDVMSGASRIFSLRNKKTGEPHVTIETRPGEITPLDLPPELYDEYRRHMAQGISAHGGRPGSTEWVKHFHPEVAEQIIPPEQIVQIKGKANRAPKEEYLPYVQDFVRSGKWSDVGDLENSGLMQVEGFKHGGMDPQIYEAVRNELGDYATMDDILNTAERLMGKKPEGYAQGGLVDGATEYNPLEVDYIYNNVIRGYAEGGSVENTHLPYDEAKISSLVNALREELHA